MRSRLASSIERGAPVVAGLLLCALALRGAPLVFRADAWPYLGLGAVLGHLAADLVSGIVHWLCDTFFAEDTPVIGRALIAPFREHHRDPLAITRHDFFEVNASNCMAMIPILAALGWSDAAGRDGPTAVVGFGFAVTFALAVGLTNQLHKWAHATHVPRAAVWLQRARLIVTPEGHARHHRSGGGRAFCVTNGWCNPLLDRFEVFGILTRRLRALRRRTGVEAA